jgi:RNA polymerase sigma-70 factor (ECF subfamily)
LVDWDELFEAHADDVIRVCWRILGRRADVEDCVQETFVQAFQREQCETVRNWPGLLRRIAVMTALALLRKRKMRHDTSLSESAYDPPASDESPDQLAIRRELENRLRREVGALPDQEAAVFCLRYFESFSVSETANTLAISNGAVAAASHRARGHLEQRMADVLGTAPQE